MIQLIVTDSRDARGMDDDRTREGSGRQVFKPAGQGAEIQSPRPEILGHTGPQVTAGAGYDDFRHSPVAFNIAKPSAGTG